MSVTSLHSFSGATTAGAVWPGDRIGGQWFYGMTSGRHTRRCVGTVFRFTPSGALTTVHSFSEPTASPVDLFAASDGNVYGLTEGGGDFGNGTIFVIDSRRQRPDHPQYPAQCRHEHDEPRQGERRPILRHGGTGGDAEWGTIFTIDDAGTVTILHSFAGRRQETARDRHGLMQSRDGRLYGTTTRRQGDYGAAEPCIRSISAGDYQHTPPLLGEQRRWSFSPGRSARSQ